MVTLRNLRAGVLATGTAGVARLSNVHIASNTGAAVAETAGGSVLSSTTASRG